MKYFVRTYGCQMNVADSDEMSRHLRARGLIATEDPEDAAIYLVNTCTVRQHAEDRALSEIGRLRRWKVGGRGRKVVITGCAAQRTKEWLEDRFPHIDLVVGARSIDDFGEAVDRLLADPEGTASLDHAVCASTGPASAFVTIMRGCNYSCTYCIVPHVRGRETYRPMVEILDDVRLRVAEGAREITLLGQTVNSYHRDGSRGRNTDFADLLEAVAAVPGVDRIRFISPHPFYMTPRVIEAMAAVPQVCEALHLPVQSGSSRMLRAMMRNYSREQYLDLVQNLRQAMHGLALTTDVIVGFPGEDESDFAETLSLIENVRFNFGFIFKYSPRTGTPAAERECLPQELIAERHQVCLALADRIAIEKRIELNGTHQEVLVEDNDTGRTRTNYKVALAASGPLTAGQTVRARITDTDRMTLTGVVEA